MATNIVGNVQKTLNSLNDFQLYMGFCNEDEVDFCVTNAIYDLKLLSFMSIC